MEPACDVGGSIRAGIVDQDKFCLVDGNAEEFREGDRAVDEGVDAAEAAVVGEHDLTSHESSQGPQSGACSTVAHEARHSFSMGDTLVTPQGERSTGERQIPDGLVLDSESSFPEQQQGQKGYVDTILNENRTLDAVSLIVENGLLKQKEVRAGDEHTSMKDNQNSSETKVLALEHSVSGQREAEIRMGHTSTRELQGSGDDVSKDQKAGKEITQEVGVGNGDTSIVEKINLATEDGVSPKESDDDTKELKEVTTAPLLKKTSLCSYFRKKGCRHGADCTFAHGESELQPRPDGSWDPTSDRAKKILVSGKDENAGGATEQSGLLQKCIVHVPRGWSQDKLKSFLNQNHVPFKTAKKRKTMNVCFVGFETAENVAKSAEILEGMTVQNKRLKFADVLPRAWEQQKAAGVIENTIGDDGDTAEDAIMGSADMDLDNTGEATGGDAGGNAEATAKCLEPFRDVCQVVTPFAHMSYEEQLSTKKDAITQVLKRLARNIRKGCPPSVLLPEWLVAARDRDGLPCEFEGVLASPLVDGYRNKCEFSIGCGPDGKRVVGFQLGTFREGINAVAEPNKCRNVSRVALAYVAAIQAFVCTSKLSVWSKENNTGFWRMLTIREGRKQIDMENLESEAPHEISEVMLVVQVCPLGVPEERRTREYANMAQALLTASAAACPPLPLTALLVQDHVGVSNAAPSDAPLHLLPLHSDSVAEEAKGKSPKVSPTGHIHDYIGSLRFRISPTAFFQVNTTAADRLYSLAGDWARLGPETLLFDVCCGTGTIGLTLAHRVGMVVGIEMNASAVADAWINAKINGISNCRFVCGKAEDVMNDLLKEYFIGVPELSEDAHDSNDTPSGDEGAKKDSDKTMREADVSKSGSGEKEAKEGESDAQKDIEEPSNSEVEKRPLASDKEDNGAKGIKDSEKTMREADVSKRGSGEKDAKEGESDAQKDIEEPSNSEVEKRPQFTNVVAIVDPPRVGLHHVVLKTLRLHKQLRRLVYISCNPDSLLANCVELCMPLKEGSNEDTGKVKGGRAGGGFRGTTNLGHARRRVKTLPASEPFKPVKAAAVDLFPHTRHCEMVMLLER